MSYIGNEPIVSATRTVTEITATAGQTVFTANGGYTVGYIDVFVNGAQLQNTDFTATNGSSITLNEATQVNDVVRLVAWGTFNTSSFQGNLTFTGTGNRILGDFSNATQSSRAAIQTSTTNGATTLSILPNGTSTVSAIQVVNNSNPDNAGRVLLSITDTVASVNSTTTGSGTALPLTLNTFGSERLRIDTSGRVGIGTSSPARRLDVIEDVQYQLRVGTAASNSYDIGRSPNDGLFYFYGNQSGANGYVFSGANGERMRITSGGDLQFNSGYGSVATAYGCRAWVNFNGTGTVAIRASGNVSSITDNGTGNYTVNFTNAMPDVNYGCHFGFPSFATNDIALNVAVRGTLAGGPNNKTTTAVSILSGRAFNTVLDDLVDIYVAIFR